MAPDTTDQDLMLAFQAGSVPAFDELFRRYEQPIWGFFRRRVADRGHAEELAQDTFLAVIEAAARYEPRATFRAYLYGIAFNLLADSRRKTHIHAAPPPRLEPSVTPSVDDDLWMRQAVGRLDEMDRAVVMLREFEELSYVEIASVLHIPVNTVRSRLFRAREALRQLLAPARITKGPVS